MVVVPSPSVSFVSFWCLSSFTHELLPVRLICARDINVKAGEAVQLA